MKIKQNILRTNYKDGGLKSVDIEHKTASLKCSYCENTLTIFIVGN